MKIFNIQLGVFVLEMALLIYAYFSGCSDRTIIFIGIWTIVVQNFWLNTEE